MKMRAGPHLGGLQLQPGVCFLGNASAVAFPTVPKQITVFGTF